MSNPLTNEPVVTATVALIAAAGALLAACGVHLTQQQIDAAIEFAQAAIAAALLVRSQVTPKARQPAAPAAPAPVVVVTPEALAAAGQ